MDPTFCLKLLIEKRREFNLEVHLLFIDYEKAFDNIQRQILFNIMKSRHTVKGKSGYLHTKQNIDKI
jgi:predicted phosphoadenosine phosphosulfate sulfurtransferase